MSLTLDPPWAGAASALLNRTAVAGQSHAILGHVDDAHHLARLERAIAVALSPLDYPDVTAWANALTAVLCAVAEADSGVVLLPGRPLPWHSVVRAPDCAEGERVEPTTPLHDEITERLLTGATGDLVLWARDDLADGNGRSAASISPDTVGVRVRTDRGEVAAVCVHRDRTLGPAPASLLATLRAIAPAFRAGVGTWVSATSARMSVARMLDSLADAALLYDAAGGLVHANPAAIRLTSSVDSARLRNEAQRIAWALGATAHRRGGRGHGRDSNAPSPHAAPGRGVQVGVMVYQLRGTIVGEQLSGGEPAVLVTITAAASKPLTDDDLRTEYELTARETQVARLMAEGLSNSEIAERLGVRFFTARNHVERTLAKLGVGSRHRVGPLLRNESTDHAPRESAA